MTDRRRDEEKKNLEALLKERKKIIYNFVLLFATVFVVLIGVATMAWFVNSLKVQDTNNTVAAASEFGFELRVESLVNKENTGALSFEQSGTKPNLIFTPSEIYGKAQEGSGAKRFNGKDGDRTATSSAVYYTTNGANPSIKWRLTDEYDDAGIGPNSQGVLRFYVIPKQSGSFDVQFQISLEGYEAVQTQNADGSYNVTSISPITTTSSATAQAAVNFLKGHLVFFKDRTEVSSSSGRPKYEYSGLLDITDFKLSDLVGTVNATKDEPIEVNIYWIWPNTFGQMVFATSDNNYQQTVADNATRPSLQKYILDNRLNVFVLNNGENSDTLKSMMATQVEGNDTFSETVVRTGSNFSDLSLRYNKADQQIGLNVKYVLITLSAE